MNMKKLFEIGIINTLRLNFYYFGYKKIFKPTILASRHLKINQLSGTVIAHDKSKGAIQLGFGYVGIIDKKYKRTLWENSGIIEFKGKASLGIGSKIVCSGHLVFGENSVINANSDIICNKKIVIGENFLLSWECLLMDTDFHQIYTENKPEVAINSNRSIYIGKHVWIGCRSTILKGAQIPDNSVISACSKITKTLLVPNAVYSDGILIRKNINWRS